MATTHVGNCFCGAVELQVTGEPAAIGYCHCTSCRAGAQDLSTALLCDPRERESDEGCRAHQGISQECQQSPSVVQPLWWPPDDQSSGVEAGRCVCSHGTVTELQAGCSRELPRDSTSNERRFAQDARLPEGTRRLWRDHDGIVKLASEQESGGVKDCDLSQTCLDRSSSVTRTALSADLCHMAKARKQATESDKDAVAPLIWLKSDGPKKQLDNR